MKPIVTIACLFLLGTVMYADALDDIIAQTQSADPVTRMSAFPNLVAYLSVTPVDPRAVNATIALLTLETKQANAVDNDADYYGDLVATTAQLNAPSAIPALVQVIGTGILVPKAIGGNLHVPNNGTVQVTNNKAANILHCQNNSSITGSGNTATQKQGQCASF